MRSALLLPSFAFALSAAAVLSLAPAPSHACSPPNGWSYVKPTFAAPLATDRGIPLGSTTSSTATETVATVRDPSGATVPGKVVTDTRGQLVFVPSAPLAPRTDYRVALTFPTAAAGASPVELTLTTGDGPLGTIAAPKSSSTRITQVWERFAADDGAVCCDGGTPALKCGAPTEGHCFSTKGEPRMKLAVEWSAAALPPDPYLEARLVEENGPVSARVSSGEGSYTIEFKQQQAEYCAVLAVFDTTAGTEPVAKGERVCVPHGDEPPLASYAPDFGEDLRVCKSAPKGWEDGWERAKAGERVAGPDATAAERSGGCTMGTQGGQAASSTPLLVALGLGLSWARRLRQRPQRRAVR